MDPIPSQIGPYIVERELGRGGMGIVYLGSDARLGRAVAIKGLPAGVEQDSELLARFEREARLLGSLNHTHIATVYGLEEHAGARYLVMEFVEGQTLAAELAAGPLSVEESLQIASQTAAALESAHEAGVIHRDLKPGNIMVSGSARVKVLDFGLAKSAAGTRGPSSRTDARASADSPTLSLRPQEELSAATIPGRIMGTAGYLSPEQARGRVVDRRTDVFSFGCVLYECLTGVRAFKGDTVTDVIAAVIERDPDWSKLPANTPPRIRELLSKCLEKDATKRLRDMGDARLEIEKSIAGREWTSSFIAAQSGLYVPSASRSGPPRALVIALMLMVGLLAAALVWQTTQKPRVERPVMRFAVPFPEELSGQYPEVGSDGKWLVFIGRPREANESATAIPRLYARRLDEAEARPLPGTERVYGYCISPDGQWVAYTIGDSNARTNIRLMKQRLDGSTPPSLVGVSPDDRPLSSVVWPEGGEILSVTSHPPRLRAFPVGGGEMIRDVEIQLSGSAGGLSAPSILPGGRYLLFGWWRHTKRSFSSACVAVDVQTGEMTTLIDEGSSPRWSESGHLVFSRDDTFFGVAFDPVTLQVKGSPFSIGQGLWTGSAIASGSFHLGNAGIMTYLPGTAAGENRRVMQLTDGQDPTPLTEDRRLFETGILVPSPDGSRLAATVANSAGIYEIWMLEKGKTRFEPVLRVAGADCGPGVWSRDGKTLYYMRQSSEGDQDGVWSMRPGEGGEPRKLIRNVDPYFVIVMTAISADDRWLIGTGFSGVGSDLVALDLNAPESGIRVLMSGSPRCEMPQFSPDGKLISFWSNDSGQGEIYIARFAPDAAALQDKRLVGPSSSTASWRATKDPATAEILLQTMADSLLAHSISIEPGITIGPARTIADLKNARVNGMVATMPDGRLLYIERGIDEELPRHFAVTLNFDQEILKKERMVIGAGTSK